MATLRPFDKLPGLNEAVMLLVGTDAHLQELLVEAMLKEPKGFDLKIHLAKSLPLPSEGDHQRPRIDLVVFLVNLQSQLSFSTVESSLAHLDSSFFLGKVSFLVVGGVYGASYLQLVRRGCIKADNHAKARKSSTFWRPTGICGRVKHCTVEMSAVKALADAHLSTLLLTELESEASRINTAQQLLRMLKVCAGLVPGVSALYLGSVFKRPAPLFQNN
ncbi:centromere protein M isoform X1 [Pleurodeles waltl]|uniref:centromere protein M isoform X1 n=1 Tax=Pleurodeles waltl TaxID=8319 RepID=UPI0037098B30